jgi:hypothetical protein
MVNGNGYNITYVRLLLAILELLFIILSYFTLHYLRLFMVILKFLNILNYFTLSYFLLF